MSKNYLMGEDIVGRVLVTVDKVEFQGADFMVAHFRELEKRLILDATNIRRLEQIAGTTDEDAWGGCRVILDGVDKYDSRFLYGIRVDAPIRLVAPPGADTAPGLGTP